MILGILSDSHGSVSAVRAAVDILQAAGAAHFIHCGDVCGLEVFDQFVGKPLTFVWGNCDINDRATSAYLESVGIPAPVEVPTIREFDGRSVAVFHGHEREFQRAASLGVDYVLHGHSHVRRDERLGDTRFINPGALYRTPVKSVATLDLAADKLDFHELR